MSDNKKNPFALTDRTVDFDSSDVAGNHVMGILAYLSWLVLVPIFAAKDSRYARFHANQGLLLAILETVIGIASGILRSIGNHVWIGLPFYLAAWLVGLLQIPVVVYAIIAFIGAIRGRAMEIPFINSIKILK